MAITLKAKKCPNGSNEGLNAFLIFKLIFYYIKAIKNGMLLQRPILPHCALIDVNTISNEKHVTHKSILKVNYIQTIFFHADLSIYIKRFFFRL